MKKIDKTSLLHMLQHAAWFGLVTGLVEGILLLVFHQTHFLTWRLYNRAYWYETLWIAPIVDVVLFTLTGLVFILAGYFFENLLLKKSFWFMLSFLCVFDWLFIVLFGRISLFAILFLAGGVSSQIFNVIAKRENVIRKSLPWLAGITVAVFVAIQGGGWVGEKINTAKLPPSQPGAPNVVVIVVDTLRADHLSSYGYDRDTSPFMDSLAQEGVRFENAIAPSSWTQPSHASLLTGRYTYEHKAETRPLDKTYPTIGETLQTFGYRTGAFSANTEFFTRRQGFGRGFLHFEDNYLKATDDFLYSSLYGFLFDFYGLRKALDYEGVPTRRYAADINRSMLAWVDQKQDKPFFVFINYFDVHDPYLPPAPYRSMYSSLPNPGGLINGFVERYHPDLTPEQLQSEIDAYDGAISYVDDQIKDLFSELKKRNLLDNTVVIIVSDHGESLGEHGLLQHSASLYMQEIHVPLIVWGPGVVPSGKTIDTPVTISALPETIVTLIGANQTQFPGPSLTLLMSVENTPADWPDPIAELARFDGAAEQNPSTHGEMKTVVGLNLQYIVHEKFGEELYNWQEDPQETNNLVGQFSLQPDVEGFKTYLQDLIGEFFTKR